MQEDTLTNMAGFLEALRQRLKIVMDVAGAYDELQYFRFRSTHSLTEKRLYPLAQSIEARFNTVRALIQAALEEKETGVPYRNGFDVDELKATERQVWDIAKDLHMFGMLIKEQLLPRMQEDENGLQRIVERSAMAQINTQAAVVVATQGAVVPTFSESIGDYAPYFNPESPAWSAYLDAITTTVQNLWEINRSVLVQSVSKETQRIWDWLLVGIHIDGLDTHGRSIP